MYRPHASYISMLLFFDLLNDHLFFCGATVTADDTGCPRGSFFFFGKRGNKEVFYLEAYS